MKHRAHSILCAACATLGAAGTAQATQVSLCTDAGRITIELLEEEAPAQTESFLRYVAEGHYTGTVFHRVIDDFMIQGGGFDRELRQRPAARSVENESRNGRSNLRGTVAAARTSDPHSAAAQFYINVIDNTYLDASGTDWGYTVFAEVADGMDVVDAIAALPTGPGGPFPSDVPSPLVTILSAAVVDPAALEEIDGPDIQAALLAKIDAAQEMNSPAEVLAWIDHYRASCAPAGADLLVIEARNALAADRPMRARYALAEFFATAPESHGNHDEAVRLRDQMAPADARADAQNAMANCLAPEPPAVPDGTREEFEGMIRAQTAVQAFMRSSTAYLECLDALIDDDRNSPESRAAAITRYNDMVDLTKRVGEDFNRQVRAFRARQ